MSLVHTFWVLHNYVQPTATLHDQLSPNQWTTNWGDLSSQLAEIYMVYREWLPVVQISDWEPSKAYKNLQHQLHPELKPELSNASMVLSNALANPWNSWDHGIPNMQGFFLRYRDNVLFLFAPPPSVSHQDHPLPCPPLSLLTDHTPLTSTDWDTFPPAHNADTHTPLQQATTLQTALQQLYCMPFTIEGGGPRHKCLGFVFDRGRFKPSTSPRLATLFRPVTSSINVKITKAGLMSQTPPPSHLVAVLVQ